MTITVALDPNNSPEKNKAEFSAALVSYNTRGGEIRLPRSEVPIHIEPGLISTKRNIEIVGEGSACGYEDSFAGTQLLATSNSAPLLTLNGVDSSNPAGSYAVLRNFSINGNNICDIGLKVGGIVKLEKFDVTKTKQAGIHLSEWINSTSLDDVSVVGNENLGLWVGGQGVKSNTAFYARRFISRANGAGVRLENAMGFSFRDSIIESNYREAIQFYRPINTDLCDGTFDNVWLEGNYRGLEGYSITSGCESDAQRPTNMKFINNCRISTGGLAKSMNLQSAEKWLFDDLLVNGTGNILMDANCINTGFIDGPDQSIITDLGTGNWFRSRNSGGSTVVNNYYSSGGAGATEKDWLPVITTDSAAPTFSYNVRIGRSVRVGDWVTCYFATDITVTSAGSGWRALAVASLPYPPASDNQVSSSWTRGGSILANPGTNLETTMKFNHDNPGAASLLTFVQVGSVASSMSGLQSGKYAGLLTYKAAPLQ